MDLFEVKLEILILMSFDNALTPIVDDSRDKYHICSYYGNR